MLEYFLRVWITKLFFSPARFLLKMSLTPNIVTIIGLIGVVVGSFVFLVNGHFIIGTIWIALFCLFDLFDGLMARLSNNVTAWGGILDSACDRIADASIFGALLFLFIRDKDYFMMYLTYYVIIMTMLVPYVRAKALAVNIRKLVGIFGRGERLVIVLTSTFMRSVVGVTYIQDIAMIIIAIGSSITFVQRMMLIYNKA